MYTNKDLQKHLGQEHKISPISEYLKEIVYGGIDGIVTTFAVVAGFAGAQNSASISGSIPIFTVLLFGFANLFADGISMGLGNFLSVVTEKDVFKHESDKELHEMRNNREMEIAETIQILQNKGFSQKDAENMTALLIKNEPYWLNFMMTEELNLENPHNQNPYLTGLTTFGSFIFFGLVPVLPYLILKNQISPQNIFSISIVSTFIALVILGLLRWKVTKQGAIRTLGETLLLGGASAGIAFLVGTFFKI